MVTAGRPYYAPLAEAPLVQAEEGFADAVRQGLRDLHRPDLLARNPLLRTRLARGVADPSPPGAEVLRRLLETGVDTLRGHPRDDKLLQVAPKAVRLRQARHRPRRSHRRLADARAADGRRAR